MSEDETSVEVTLPDGTVAWWTRVLDDATIDRLTNAIEGVIGDPDGMRV